MLGHFVDDCLAHLSTDTGGWDEDDTLLNLDLFGSKDRRRELSRKTGLDGPVDGIAMEDDCLLMHVCFTKLVDDTTELELLDVAVVGTAKEGDTVEVGRSAGLEGELSAERYDGESARLRGKQTESINGLLHRFAVRSLNGTLEWTNDLKDSERIGQLGVPCRAIAIQF